MSSVQCHASLGSTRALFASPLRCSPACHLPFASGLTARAVPVPVSRGPDTLDTLDWTQCTQWAPRHSVSTDCRAARCSASFSLQFSVHKSRLASCVCQSREELRGEAVGAPASRASRRLIARPSVARRRRRGERFAALSSPFLSASRRVRGQCPQSRVE